MKKLKKDAISIYKIFFCHIFTGKYIFKTVRPKNTANTEKTNFNSTSGLESAFKSAESHFYYPVYYPEQSFYME